jgi:hypothetical protein
VNTLFPGSRLRALALVVAMASLLLFAAACGDDDDNGNGRATPTPGTPAQGGSPSPAPATPTPVPTVYPDNTRTNIPSVDAIIDRVLAGDRDSLRNLVEYTSVACEQNPQGGGAPPKCEAGEQGGAMVEVLLASQCEGFWVRPGEVNQVLDPLVQGDPKLYAIYRVTKALGPLPADGHGVVFLAPDNKARTVRVTNEGIVAIGLGCSANPTEALQGENDFVLPPR